MSHGRLLHVVFEHPNGVAFSIHSNNPVHFCICFCFSSRSNGASCYIFLLLPALPPRLRNHLLEQIFIPKVQGKEVSARLRHASLLLLVPVCFLEHISGGLQRLVRESVQARTRAGSVMTRFRHAVRSELAVTGEELSLLRLRISTLHGRFPSEGREIHCKGLVSRGCFRRRWLPLRVTYPFPPIHRCMVCWRCFVNG